MTDEEVRFGIIDDPHAKPTDEVFWRDVRVVMPRGINAILGRV